VTDNPTDIIRSHYRPQRAATRHILDKTGVQATICFIIAPFVFGMLGGITIILLTHWIN